MCFSVQVRGFEPVLLAVFVIFSRSALLLARKKQRSAGCSDLYHSVLRSLVHNDYVVCILILEKKYRRDQDSRDKQARDELQAPKNFFYCNHCNPIRE